MRLSNEQLKEIGQWAELLFSPKEIATVMELDECDVLREYNDESSVIYKCVQRGKLKTEGEVRKSILQLAKDGSASAQEQAMKIIEKYNLL